MAAPRRLTLLITKASFVRRNFSYSTATKPVDPGSKWPVEELNGAVRSGSLHVSLQTAIQILKTFHAKGASSAEQICTSQYGSVSSSGGVQ